MHELDQLQANIQKLTLKQLREAGKNSVFLFKNNGEIQAPIEETDIPIETEHISTSIQQLSLRALRALRKEIL